MKARYLLPALLVLAMTTGAWAQERAGLLDIGNKSAPVVVTKDSGSAWDTRMWDFNIKQMLEQQQERYNRLSVLAEMALQNTVENTNQQKINATNWANADAHLSRNAVLFQGVTGAAGQGRQLTNADVSQGRTFATTDVAVGAIQAEVARAMSAMTPPLIEAVTGAVVAKLEALRNPPVGSGSTGQGLPVGPGERPNTPGQ